MKKFSAGVVGVLGLLLLLGVGPTMAEPTKSCFDLPTFAQVKKEWFLFGQNAQGMADLFRLAFGQPLSGFGDVIPKSVEAVAWEQNLETGVQVLVFIDRSNCRSILLKFRMAPNDPLLAQLHALRQKKDKPAAPEAPEREEVVSSKERVAQAQPATASSGGKK